MDHAPNDSASDATQNLTSTVTSESDAQRMVGAVNALLARFLVRGADGTPRPIPYNPVDYAVLRFFAAAPDRRATDFAAASGIAATTLQSALDRLTRKGLLEKRAHPTDGRARLYRLSEAGRQAQAAITAQDTTNMQAMLDVMDDADRRIVVDALTRMAAALGSS